MEKTYTTQRYFSAKAIICCLLAFLLLSALLILIGMILKFNRYSFYIAYAILCVTPFVFLRNLRSYFNRNIVAEFSDESLIIKEYSLKTEDLIYEFSCRWENIKSYKCTFSSGKYTTIIINLSNGANKYYLFKDNKTEDESLQTDSIFKAFFLFIKNHNDNKLSGEKIEFCPLFLATKFGLIFIILLSILCVAAVLSQLLLANKLLPISLLIGVNLVFQLIMRHVNYKKTYNKILKLDTDTIS